MKDAKGHLWVLLVMIYSLSTESLRKGKHTAGMGRPGNNSKPVIISYLKPSGC